RSALGVGPRTPATTRLLAPRITPCPPDISGPRAGERSERRDAVCACAMKLREARQRDPAEREHSESGVLRGGIAQGRETEGGAVAGLRVAREDWRERGVVAAQSRGDREVGEAVCAGSAEARRVGVIGATPGENGGVAPSGASPMLASRSMEAKRGSCTAGAEHDTRQGQVRGEFFERHASLGVAPPNQRSAGLDQLFDREERPEASRFVNRAIHNWEHRGQHRWDVDGRSRAPFTICVASHLATRSACRARLSRRRRGVSRCRLSALRARGPSSTPRRWCRRARSGRCCVRYPCTLCRSSF
ncbi:MAG: hypothetical protein ACI82G_002719, partial [Bradymonadia bacterium]